MKACLDLNEIIMHPFVLGELALGSMPRYDAVLNALTVLPAIQIAQLDEVLVMVRNNKLMGTGIGYIDAHVLASAVIVPDTHLWTRDKRLRRAAERFGVASALP
jgi:predicted nucleic acid-binding protein